MEMAINAIFNYISKRFAVEGGCPHGGHIGARGNIEPSGLYDGDANDLNDRHAIAHAARARNRYDSFPAGAEFGTCISNAPPEAKVTLRTFSHGAERTRASAVPVRTQWDPIALERYSASVNPSWGEYGLEFPGQASVPGFCAAAERASPPGFQISSAIVRTEEGDVAAMSPVFRTSYRLDTSLPVILRRPIALLERIVPGVVTLPVLGLGSPMMDRCAVGFRASSSTSERAEAFSCLLDGVEAAAQDTGTNLIAVKDFGDRERCWADSVLRTRRYARLASLPIAVLDLPFASEDEYLSTLSSSVRRSLRRKLRQSASLVQITECSTITGLEGEIARLYEETRSNRKADYGDFDALSPDYVQKILEGVNGGAKVLLGRINGVLASFALILVGANCAFAHQIGMRYSLAREHNLYFLNWIAVVRFCLDRGIRRLEFGQTSYPLKLRLGCRLEPSWIHFRHRTAPVNAVLRYLAPKFGFDRVELGGLA